MMHPIARRALLSSRSRPFATVGPKTMLGNPPKIPVPLSPGPEPESGSSEPQPQAQNPLVPTSILNRHILSALSIAGPSLKGSSLPVLIEQYKERHGRVLGESLQYESRPGEGRKVRFDQGVEGGEGENGEVVMIAHALRHRGEFKVTVCSGFALNAQGSEEALVVSCAHTFEEIRNSRLATDLLTSNPFLQSLTDSEHQSGSFIIAGTPDAPIFHPVSSIASALHRSDLLVLSSPSTSSPRPRTLPVSPYPAQPGTSIRAHFVVDKKPTEDEEGWKPWIGGTWSKWVKGTVMEYRDFAGREAVPGTYDSLSHLLFKPLPTPGSSGGPIIDEESGAVVGVMLGSRMDNRIVGMRGWGAPSETIFEMFSLPGLKLKNNL
ncbi:hypothetical protein EIP91_012288 [Steccherinum ochraceum]|uniref:Serine protease n=1 Tax=Steccherinum ochraceum TaxID=92696 RepID=A0A4R0RX62_9APHY|nr:hypothetical protein EIP91_012288 [Steccherinum ochraceum]